MADTQYEDLLRRCLDTGNPRADRTGTGTRAIFGAQLRYDLSQGFPLITTKRVHFRSVAVELLWMLSGDTNIDYLKVHGVNIWDEWADSQGDLGPVYGEQWRRWSSPEAGWHHDQIAELIHLLRTDPASRRMIVSAWNVGELPNMRLPPCHILFQTFVETTPLGKVMSLQVYQRSADLFLGVPFNIASYALLLILLSVEVGMIPGELIWTGGDCHLYDNHIEQAREQLSRDVRPFPRLGLVRQSNLLLYTPNDFEILDYNPHPAIKADVAV